MQRKEFEVITLKWEKIINLDWGKQENDIPDASGIYQIYGTSPLYGVDTLLYIGQATNLRDRMKVYFNNEEHFIGRQPNKSLRYALLPSDLLTIVEETLIVMYKPCFNSARLIQVTSSVRKKAIYIQNHGERGMLNIENTNYYFLNLPEKEVQSELIPLSEN